MYGKYVYKASSNVNNVLNDIGLLLTGTTDKNLLSSDCDKVNSDIIATDAAGWTEVTTDAGLSVYSALSGSTAFTNAASNGSVVIYTPYVSTNISSIYRSTDGGITTSVINLGTLGAWAFLYYSTSLNIFFLTTGSTGNYYISTDNGVTWQLKTGFPLIMGYGFTGQEFLGKLVVFSHFYNSSNTCYYTSDGITWTAFNYPFYPTILYNSSSCVLNGKLYVSGNGYLFYTIDLVNWVSLTPPLPINRCPYIATDGTDLYLFGTFTLQNSYISKSTDGGVTWVTSSLYGIYNSNTETNILYRNNIFYMVFTNAATSMLIYQFNKNFSSLDVTSTTLTVTSGTGGRSFYVNNTIGFPPGQILSSGITYLIKGYNKLFKAINAKGTPYKYMRVVLDTSTNTLYTHVAESIDGDAVTNLCYNSNNSVYSQRYNLTYGGIIYIFASVRKAIFYTYVNTLATWGSSTGGTPSGCIEIDGSDQWFNTYPSYGWVNFFQYMYLPKTPTGGVGAGGLLYYLFSINTAKQVLDSGGNPVPMIGEISYCNATTYGYTTMGGKVLGNVYTMTASIGANLDEISVNGNTYVVIPASTFKLLLPKY